MYRCYWKHKDGGKTMFVAEQVRLYTAALVCDANSHVALCEVNDPCKQTLT
jgi:hypothetical protein